MAALSSVPSHPSQPNPADGLVDAHTKDLTQSGQAAEPANDSHPAAKSFSSGRVHSSLIFRLGLMNLLAFALLGAAWYEGYVHSVMQADKTGLSFAIFAVFLVGFGIAMWRGVQISKEIDAFAKTAPTIDVDISQAGTSSALRMRLAQRIAAVRHIANTLVLLGLIGTVLGFIIALSGVDPDNASDVSNIAPMVSTLIQGMSTALYTTLIGSILNVWLMANYQLLSGGTVSLMSLWLERADSSNA